MKLTFPSRVPLKWVISFTFVLFVAELVEGSTFGMAAASNAFLLVAGIAFNLAGGMQYPSGAYVLFNALLTCTVGILGKVVLGEPLQTNLNAPQRTMNVYLLGMCSMCAAVAVNHAFRRRKGLLPDSLEGVRTDQVAIGCVLLAILPQHILPASTVATFVQFNYFGVLAVMLPVYQKVKDTEGRSSFSLVAAGVWVYLTIQFGFLQFSKQGLFLPTFAWAAAALAAGYRISLRRLVLLVAIAIPVMSLLTAFSQVGRNFRYADDPAAIALDLVKHPLETRRTYEDAQLENLMFGFGYHWYNEPRGLLDRLSTVPIDDALIYVTDHGSPGSLDTVWGYFLNLVPHYLYPDKPMLRTGNIYGHEIHIIGDDDEVTGISFSPYADAYHSGRWFCVTLISCPLYLLLFFISDSLTGRATDSRWALLYILWFSHSASEGLLSALVYGAGTFSMVVLGAHLVATRFAPLLGSMVTLPQREWSKRHLLSSPENARTLQSTQV